MKKPCKGSIEWYKQMNNAINKELFIIMDIKYKFFKRSWLIRLRHFVDPEKVYQSLLENYIHNVKAQLSGDKRIKVIDIADSKGNHIKSNSFIP